MKKHLLLLFTALLPLVASAEKVEIDGIWYNLVSKVKQAEVTNNGNGSYSGDITIPATITYGGVTYSVTGIGEGAFYDCTSLTAITLPESVTSIGEWAFAGCSRLTTITLPEGVTSIGDLTFEGCRSLTAITLPEGVTSIGKGAFDGCSSLTAVHISNIEAWCKIEFRSNPLSYAHNLYLNGELVTNLVIPEGVTSIGKGAFDGCSSLTAITLPESVTSIGDGAFRDCSSLTAINIPEGVTGIGSYAFSGCSSLTAINIPEGVKSIGKGAFADCTSLTAITIPKGVTNIGSSAFSGCSSLTAVTLPESLTSIGDYAFYGCSSLTDINIPEGVTSIGDEVFRGCSSLTAVTIPEGVTSIGSKAFANCSELTDVYCYAETVPSTNTDAFDGSYIEYATLHVPASAANEYKNTAPWSGFGKVETLEITVDEITLSQSAAELIEGESLQLTATVSPDDAEDKSISWGSSNPSIATVDNAGKVTAIAPGTATITVTANDGSGVSAQCEVTVTPASYVITFLIDGEQFFVETLTRGSAITLPEVPAKEGYTFSGWGEVPETMPAKDVTISGTFIINKYLVTFKIDDEVIIADSLEYGTAIVAPEAPEKEGYTFNGWGEVAGNVPAHDLTYEGSYSINSYTLTYVVDGEAVLTLPIVYGATIPSLKAPEKEGYTFSGWSEAPETMPAKDVTISSTFIINKYLVTFKIDDEVIIAESLEYGTAIVAPEAPEKEGYTFSGWGEVAENVPAYDLTYEGSYSINSYTLTYMVDGEAVLTLPMVYGATIPSLKAPEKEGYKFSGWSEAPAVMPAKDVTIEGTFTQLPSIYLTINQADNGCVKQHLVVGTVCAYTIEAAEGWKIHSVTFNGEDVTSQLTEEGTFTTPALQDDATLNIAYEKIDDGIAAATASRIKVQGHQGVISITGATEGEAIGLYTTSGTLVATATAEGDTTHLTVPAGQVYIVKVADTVVKIGM